MKKSRLPLDISKARLNTLTDGIFAITMTLLVIEMRLPEHFSPQSSDQLLHVISGLAGQFLAFFVSFFVLGFRWMTLSRLMDGMEHVRRKFAFWSLVHLFLAACFPFSAMLVGRYTSFAPSIWIYALNVILSALVMIHLLSEAAVGKRCSIQNEKMREMLGLIAAALISVVVSFLSPSHAMLAYLLTIIFIVQHKI